VVRLRPGPATWDGHPRCLSPSGGDAADTSATKCPDEIARVLMRDAGFLVLASSLLQCD
jgi:hypothetical protein